MGLKQKLKIAINRLSPALGVSLLYFRQYKRFPRLRNPQLFNEKLQWLKLHVYGKDPVYTVCADKYKVREFLAERGFGDLLIPLLGVYERPEDIDFDSLPERFVLKWNFGSGYNVICNSKRELDWEATVRQLKEWGQDKDYAWRSYEMQYRDIPRRIVCEENMAFGGKRLLDYKFQCFNGEMLIGFVKKGLENGVVHWYSFDRQLRHRPHEFSAEGSVQLENPEEFFDRERILSMISIAEKLAEPFPYVRVDLYSVGEKIYFGEYTFCDGGGFDRKVRDADVAMGAALNLKAYAVGGVS
ncbi:MAG: glycosyl transferase [Bacteroidia bacterium]|jgi:hypothetical protein|nr:glycosyl transferase [Bacteroidia bacterium]